MTPRTERALIRFLLHWFELWFSRHYNCKMPQEYYDLENEVR